MLCYWQCDIATCGVYDNVQWPPDAIDPVKQLPYACHARTHNGSMVDAFGNKGSSQQHSTRPVDTCITFHCFQYILAD